MHRAASPNAPLVVTLVRTLVAANLALYSSITYGGTPSPVRAVAQVNPEVKAVAEMEGASHITQLSFAPKSWKLSKAAVQRVRDLIKQARAAGQISSVYLIVWADREYPSSKEGSLPSEDVRLADRRAKALSDLLRAEKVRGVLEAYNMAERPNTIQSVLSTADARIKKSLEGAGMATTATETNRAEFASKGVVLILSAK